jgi:putative Ca2+/H+ antiporter (TMEM165/GDT1 family)
MPSFFLALIAVLLTSIGSRDQVLVAQLSARLGRNPGLLVAGWLVAIISACVMAWAGHVAAQILPPEGKTMLVAIAMLLAAVELFWPTTRKAANEPTRSLFAITLVLLSRQFGDAGRFLVFAIAASTGAPLLAAIGGALGGGAALTIGWIAAEDLEKMSLRKVRLLLAGAVLLGGLVIGLNARGLLA